MKTENLNQKTIIHGRIIALTAWIFTLIAAAILSWQVIKQYEHGSDFSSYYTAGYLVSNGESIANFYDNEWFGNQIHKIRPDLNDIYNANLPTTAIASVPLALIGNEKQSRIAWLLINIIAIIYIMRMSVTFINMGPIARPIWYGIILLAHPVLENFVLGQVYIVITAVILWMYHSLENEQEIKVGIILAFLFMIKTAGTFLWPYFVVQKRWKLLSAGVLTLFLIGIVTFPIIGIEGWQAYLDKAVQLSQSPYQSVTAYQTIEGWFQHMFSPNPIVQTKPIIALPLTIAHGMATFVILTLLSVSLWLAYKYPSATELHFISFSLLILVCMPVTILHAYMMALVPIILLLKTINLEPLKCHGFLILAGVAMILLPLPYKSPRFFDGYWSLLAYPKLYGALLLWLTTVWYILKAKPSSARREVIN